MLAASEQPALCDGISTVLVGLRILAVSAMNLTPQKTITSLSVCRGLAAQVERVAHEIGDGVEQRRLHVVVAEDDGVALDLQPVDLDGDLGFDAQFHIGDNLAFKFHLAYLVVQTSGCGRFTVRVVDMGQREER